MVFNGKNILNDYVVLLRTDASVLGKKSIWKLRNLGNQMN